MGRIKTVLIKTLGNEIINRYKEKLGEDFDKNKMIISGIVDIKSKKIRNILAGYVTREMKLIKSREGAKHGVKRGVRKAVRA